MTEPTTPAPTDEDEGRRFRLVALVVIGVVVVVGAGGLLLLHLTRPDATATFIQQITLLAGLVAASGGTIWGMGRIAKIQAAQRAEVAVVREQVQNSHVVGLRDDIDTKHDAVAEALGRLERGQAAILKRVQDTLDDQRADRRRVDHLAERLDEHLDHHPKETPA